MGKIENDELRKIRNAHFIRAFDHVRKVLKMGQGQLAEAIGSKNAYISNFRNGTRPVPPETVEALIHISATEPGLQIFSEYLYGYSEVMLLANVSDDEIVAAQMRHDNPDYDVMEKQRKETEQQLDSQLTQQPYIDPGSQMNAFIAEHVRLTNRLEDDLKEMKQMMFERLAEKDARIIELKAAIADKDARIADLQCQLAAAQSGDLSKYPFAIGAAEDNRQSKRL